MQKELYREYELLVMEFKKLEAYREDLRTKILESMVNENAKDVTTDFGKFTVGKRIVWEYTPKVKALEDRVKLARLNEQKRGIAHAEERSYLLYTTNKIS